MATTREEFADHLKTIRQQAGLTPRQLAGMVGIDEVRYTRIERGEVEPGVEMLSKISEALSVTPQDLLG